MTLYETKILVTGVTGYIGGSILATLVETSHNSTVKYSLSALVRGEDKAKVLESKGVKPVLFNSLDELEFLRKTASDFDIVIHSAFSFHTPSAVALISGLGDGKKKTGKDVHYLHTSGTSSLGNHPITGAFREESDRIFSDKENIFEYEKFRELETPYPQRTTDIAVVETGLLHDVKTTIIMSPEIHGKGPGFFSKHSIQIPGIIRVSLEYGYGIYIGEGSGVWNYVHIEDLMDLYRLVLFRILKGEAVPVGEKEIIFSESGKCSWKGFGENAANALFKFGAIPEDRARSISLEEATEKFKFGGGTPLKTELNFASNAVTKSDVGAELGWRPQKGEKDFKDYFDEVAGLIVGGREDELRH